MRNVTHITAIGDNGYFVAPKWADFTACTSRRSPGIAGPAARRLAAAAVETASDVIARFFADCTGAGSGHLELSWNDRETDAVAERLAPLIRRPAPP